MNLRYRINPELNLIKLIFIVFPIFFSQTSIGQTDRDKCDINKVKMVNEHSGNLTLQIIADFLCTFDKSCKSNTEFSEWSNETLFKVLYKSPGIFFRAIAKHQINTELLVGEIENPINDNIDLRKIYNKVKTTSAPPELKTKFLNALLVSITKTNNFKLNGLWRVDRYILAEISAMDDKMAIQWIGKKAIINRYLYFEYSKIPDYKEVFNENATCNLKIEQIRNSVPSDDYFFENHKSNTNLGLTQKAISIIKTNCKGTPFEEIIMLTPTQIIIQWDGAFFFLTKER